MTSTTPDRASPAPLARAWPVPVLPALVAVAVAGLWLPRLALSLWLDETVSYWIVEGGVRELLHRTLHYQAFPLYFALLKLWTGVAGVSEVALRLPSLAAMGAALFFLYRIGERLGGAELAWIAIAIFATGETILLEATDARPYALGTLLLVAAAHALLCWTETGHARSAATTALLCSLALYTHPMLALAFPAFGLYLWLARARGAPVRAGGVLLAAGIAGLLLIPWLPFLGELADRRALLSFSPAPQLPRLLFAYAPIPVLAGLAAGLLLSLLSRALRGRLQLRAPELSVPGAVLLGLWAALPPLALYLVSVLSPTRVFVARYFIAALPALALVHAYLIRSLPGRAARAAATLVVAAFGAQALIAPSGDAMRMSEDFRGAARAAGQLIASAGTPVFVVGGLIESQSEAWLNDPERASYLAAPLVYYPVGGDGGKLEGKVVAVPPPEWGEAHLDAIVTRETAGRDRFLLIERGRPATYQWLAKRARATGFRARWRRFGIITLGQFDREAEDAPTPPTPPAPPAR